MLDPIPDRECEACAACCHLLPISDPDLKKQPGVLCPNCIRGKGCQIYETRPQACRRYFCIWRLMPQLDESWRPDRSGVMLEFQPKDIPPSYSQTGVQFLVFGGADVILKDDFAEIVGRFVENNVPVFLAVPGPSGFYPSKAFLNEVIAPAIHPAIWRRCSSFS